MFAPAVKTVTVRIVLSLAVSNGWGLNQLDISNAFLHRFLQEDVFMRKPPGFVDQDHPTFVCKLRRSIYGLKQSPLAWFHRLRDFVITLGFVES